MSTIREASWVLRAALGVYLSAAVEVVGVRASSSRPRGSGAEELARDLLAGELVRVLEEGEALKASRVVRKLKAPSERWHRVAGVADEPVSGVP